MIDGLLAYSRINTLGKPLERVSLAKPISAAILDLSTALDAMNAEIVVSPDLPDVMGDLGQLKELFFHLIDNAMKYRSDKDPVVKIGCEREGDTATITVSDNGIGIDQRDSDRVFTIFKRMGFKDDVPGAGVGLAICRRIVLRHHGRISLGPASDLGTTIQFTLRTPSPITPPARAPASSAQKQEA